MKLLILEDEILAAQQLRSAVQELLPDSHVLDILDSVEAGRTWFLTNPVPDLILSDIQLADGLCFDLFQSVPVHAPIIFCTAYDQFAIRAFEANGIDYLLKPVDRDRLRLALHKFDQLKHFFGAQMEEYAHRLETTLSGLRRSYKETLLVKGHSRLLPLAVADIAFIHSSGGLVTLYTKDLQRFYPDGTLDELQESLSPKDFFRVNRQFLVRRTAIAEAQPGFARKLEVKLTMPAPEPLVVSKARATEFRRWLAED